MALKREEAEAVGYDGGVPYDALLDTYEPAMTTAQVQSAFDGLRAELVPLVQEIADSDRQPNTGILHRTYPIDKQRRIRTAGPPPPSASISTPDDWTRRLIRSAPASVRGTAA